MKKIILTALIGLAICSCSTLEQDEFELTMSSMETINKITGTYTMISASFSTPVDLSGSGFKSKDILAQLEMHGWMGTQAIAFEGEEPRVVFEQNEVLTPGEDGGSKTTQINFYVPYPHLHPYDEKNGKTVDGLCSVDMSSYQFHYQVDRKGNLHLLSVTDRKMFGDDGARWLRDVDIRFVGEMVLFSASTSFYDWSTRSWKDGTMDVVFRHN